MFKDKSWNEKTELERFETLVDEFWELVFGTVRRPEVKFEGMVTQVKPKRARTKKGTYRADDKMTKDFNEAWVGGKSPKKNVMSKKERNALDRAMKKAYKFREKK